MDSYQASGEVSLGVILLALGSGLSAMSYWIAEQSGAARYLV
jgi:hypothetical protein